MLVAFLAPEAASEITGQAIGIGGDCLTLCCPIHEVDVELGDGTS